MEAAVMSVSKVREIGELVGDQQQDLARVFINAFDDGGSKFPIDFDSVWRFLNYSNKANALRKLKGGQFVQGGDYTVKSERIHINRDDNLKGVVDQGGRPTDKYFMTTDAFQMFAMMSPGDAGNRVRRFFLAVRDAYVDLQRAPPPPPPPATEPARVDPWDQARCDGIAMFWQKGAALKRYLEARSASRDVGWAFYSQVATLLNQAIVGFSESTKAFKASRGIPGYLTIPDMLDGYGQSIRSHFELAFENYFNRPTAELALMDPAGVLVDLARMRDDMQTYLRAVRFDNIKETLLDVPEAKRRKKEYGDLRKSNALVPSPGAMKILEGIKDQQSVIV